MNKEAARKAAKVPEKNAEQSGGNSKNTHSSPYFQLVRVCFCSMYVLLGASEINHMAERDGEACQRLAHRGLGSPTHIKNSEATTRSEMEGRAPVCTANNEDTTIDATA